MNPKVVRGVRIAGVFSTAFLILFLRFTAGVVLATEADEAAPWALVAIGLLLGGGAWALEMSETGSPARRDSLWGLAVALLGFALLRLTGTL